MTIQDRATRAVRARASGDAPEEDRVRGGPI